MDNLDQTPEKPVSETPLRPAGDGTKTSKLPWLLVAGLLVLVTLLSGGYVFHKTSTPTTKAAVQARVVKLGLIAPLTGDTANYGQVMQHGIEMAQHDFNKEGLSFQIYVRDTQCDATKAAAAAQELANLGVVAILGETCSSATLAALPIANEKHIVLLSPSASSPGLSIANDYFFRTYPVDSHQGVFTAKLMIQKGIKKIAIMHSSEEYGSALDKVMVSNFESLGGKVLIDTVFKVGEVDFTTQLQTIKAAKPDALYVVSNSETSAAAVVVEAKQAGIDVPFYGSDALKDSNFSHDVGSAGNGMTLVAVTPGSKAFLNEYKAAYGAEPTSATGAQSYDAFMALAQIISKGANTGSEIRQALPKVDFQGMSGEIKFDSFGDLGGGGYIVYTIQDGKFVSTNQ